jgi:hypothetical protein
MMTILNIFNIYPLEVIRFLCQCLSQYFCGREEDTFYIGISHPAVNSRQFVSRAVLYLH